MKALSIRQPWASLIVAGVKDIENRSWPTAYRGLILVHAPKKIDERAIKIMGLPQTMVESIRHYVGGVIGQVEIVDCVKMSSSSWFEGPYGFVLKNAKELPFKQCPGQLGIFELGLDEPTEDDILPS